MKKNLLFLFLLWLGFVASSQAPQGIYYQTIVRDGDSQLLANSTVLLQMTILTGTSGGAMVYSETHSKVTNPFGIVNLVIGQGTPVFGSFSDVNWGKSEYYLETAVDLTGSGQFTILGVTQFVSVPYSLFSGQAGSILSMTNQERNALVNPPVGMQIYNLTTNCLNYYSGSYWFETCGTLVVNQPPDEPVLVEPAMNSLILPTQVTLIWDCTDPDWDPLTFDLHVMANGVGGLMVPGLTENSYTVSSLENNTPYFWKVVAYDDHGNQTEGQNWFFYTADCSPQQAYAGADGTTCDFSEYQIHGANTGLWMNVQWSSSGDGYFNDATLVNPIYTPGMMDNESDTVVLTLTSYPNPPCTNPPGFDPMNLIIQHYPTVDAGPDRTLCEGDVVNLSAVAENYDEIQWVTYTGSGTFENGNSLNSIYYPGTDEWSNGFSRVSILVSEIEPCTVSAADVVDIEYYPYPLSDAGYDQLNVVGTSTNLLGNAPPDGGYGEWTILDGTGGLVSEPANPGSLFTGVSGNTYILRWTLYSVFGCNDSDEVIIGFANEFTCGSSTVTDIDGNIYNTVMIGTQCWMKENLKTTKYRNGNSIEYPGGDNTAWANNITGAYAWYNNDIGYKDIYGALYNWYAVNNANGLCPTGWHVPTYGQWTVLSSYVKSQSAYRCNNVTNYIAKSLASKLNWNTTTCTCCVGKNLANNNATFFTGLPSGSRYINGTYYSLGMQGDWWSSSEAATTEVWEWCLSYNSNIDFQETNPKSVGSAVRCMKYLNPIIYYFLDLEVNPSSSGVVTGEGQYEKGEQVIINAVANSEWEFVSWTKENNQIITYSPEFSFTMPAMSFILIANFKKKITGNGLPCPGTPTVQDVEGNVYNTVKIGFQCWMKENLKTGTRINGSISQTNNGLIEKYCYDDLEENCSTYGGLYSWDEMMQYTINQGTQGICPSGWHLPTNDEWHELTDYVESQSSYWCNNVSDFIAKSLASNTHWNSSPYTCSVGNDLATNNATNFSSLPGGYSNDSGIFDQVGIESYYWSSTEANLLSADCRYLASYDSMVTYYLGFKPYSLSVRCLKD